jgi:hypothetical protein
VSEASSPDRLATDLLRVALDPATGRMRYRSRVDVCLRAALFADLALRGQIVSHLGAPAIVDPEPTGDRMLDAVRGTVERRPEVVWIRWFRHVSTDCPALRNELVADGRWQRQRRGWRATFTDSQADAMLAVAHELDQVTRYEREPADVREAVLATLAVMCGATGRRPRPGAVRQELAPLMASTDNDTLQKIVKAAAATMRRARRGGSGLARQPLRRAR